MEQKLKKQSAQEMKKVGAAATVENPVLIRKAETAETHVVRQPRSSSLPRKSNPKFTRIHRDS